MYENKYLLITGGTGSLGKALTKKIFEDYPQIGKVIVYSRDEQKHFKMREEFSKEEFPNLEFIIGDIRDYSSVKAAFNNVDYVIHAAAMKHVHLSENNPEGVYKNKYRWRSKCY